MPVFHRYFILRAFIAAALFLFAASFIQQDQRKISLSVTSKVLRHGKVVTIQSELFYNFDRGTILAQYKQPIHYYLMTDAKGEVRIYQPEKNEVVISRDPSQITDQSLLYFFLSNRISDLGLRENGFTLFKTSRSKDVVTTWWSPPASMAKNILKVELVHDNFLPIYMSYHNHQNSLSRKVFYYSYTQDASIPVRLPQKILEYNYFENGDSIVNQMVFSNILYGRKANSPLFDFKIPENAKIVEK